MFKRLRMFIPFLFVLTLAVGVISLSTAHADGPGDESISPSSEPSSESSTVMISEVNAEGPDVQVTMAWNPEIDLPESVNLIVRDRQGELVSEVEIQPRELGELVVESVPAALEHVDEKGLQYTITVENNEGEALIEYPYHVMLTCEDEETCSYYLIGGFYTDAAIFITEELDRALDEVEAERPDDVLKEVLNRYPELRGDVYALSMQMANLEQQEQGLASKKARSRSRCACWWTVVVSRTPISFFSQQSPTAASTAGFDGLGAEHYFAAKSRDGSISHSHSGQSNLTMKMRCWGLSGWKTITIRIKILWWTKIIRIRIPVFGYCDPQCSGTVTHNAIYGAYVKAQTSGSPGLAFAYADEDVEYSVNGHTVFSQAIDAIASPPMNNDFDSMVKSGSHTTAQPSTARLRTSGNVSVGVEEGYAYAKVVNGYQMKATANASCTIPRKVTARVPYTLIPLIPSVLPYPYLWLDSFNFIDRFLP